MRWSDLDVEDSISGVCLGDATPDAGVIDAPIDAVGIDSNTAPSSILVPDRASDAIWVIDPDTFTLTATVHVSGAAGFNSIIADTDRIWLFEAKKVWAVDYNTLDAQGGYPVTFPSIGCSGLRDFAVNGKVYCRNMGGAGTTDDRVEEWSGTPVAQTVTARNLASVNVVNGSSTRVLASYGGGTLVAVLDTTLAPVAGSPLDAPEGGADASVSDELSVITIATTNALRVFHRGDLSLVGTGSVSMPSAVAAVGFGSPSTIYASLANGAVYSVSSSNLAAQAGPVTVEAGIPLFALTHDAARGRLYGIIGATLYALDASTLVVVDQLPLGSNGAGIVLR
jgi:uncharacterized protein GlcG (DUF336 family)